MTTIEISKDITFTASEETINEYQHILLGYKRCSDSIKGALEERDWEDIDAYYEWASDLDERLRNLGGH